MVGSNVPGKILKNDPPDWLNRPFSEQIFINVIEDNSVIFNLIHHEQKYLQVKL